VCEKEWSIHGRPKQTLSRAYKAAKCWKKIIHMYIPCMYIHSLGHRGLARPPTLRYADIPHYRIYKHDVRWGRTGQITQQPRSRSPVQLAVTVHTGEHTWGKGRGGTRYQLVSRNLLPFLPPTCGMLQLHRLRKTPVSSHVDPRPICHR
jgi:hypothetical protein